MGFQMFNEARSEISCTKSTAHSGQRAGPEFHSVITDYTIVLVPKIIKKIVLVPKD